MNCKARKHEHKRSSKISSHKASQESAAWSAVLHLLKQLLCPEAPWKAALCSLRSSMRPDGDRLLLLRFSDYWRKLACGGFEIKQSKDAGEVISSFQASILADMKVATTAEGAKEKAQGLSRLKARAEDVRTGTCFIISLKELLEWPSDTVHFLQKPLSTPWKWWGRKSSKHLLGHSLLNILARAEDMTHRTALCPLEGMDKSSPDCGLGRSHPRVDDLQDNASAREQEIERENASKHKSDTQLAEADLSFANIRRNVASPGNMDDLSWCLESVLLEQCDEIMAGTKILPVEQRKRKREEDFFLSFYFE